MLCQSCMRFLADDSFYSSNKARCKECIRASVRLNRAQKIDYYRAYDRQRASDPQRVSARKSYRKTDAFRISHAAATKKLDVTNAIRKHAAVTLNNALRAGRVAKQPCFICGCAAEAHHPDYSAPLAVSWLCDSHHKQLHREHRERLREAA